MYTRQRPHKSAHKSNLRSSSLGLLESRESKGSHCVYGSDIRYRKQIIKDAPESADTAQKRDKAVSWSQQKAALSQLMAGFLQPQWKIISRVDFCQLEAENRVEIDLLCVSAVRRIY